MTDRIDLFTPVRLGTMDLPNRVLMAPLTRNRAHADGTPWDVAAIYYAQRAGAGLIFSEATQISAQGKGYLNTPGIYTDSHIAAWKKITDAVHDAGGRIVCQLWHVGRISHDSLLPDGVRPVSASAIRADAKTFTADGFQNTSEPEALSRDGIDALKSDFARAAQAAKDAGFDGVEVHAANGYLLDQFLQDGTNHRDDAYGGPVENRMRLLSEVIDTVATVWDKGRIGVRLSPLGQANDIADSDTEGLFTEVCKMLSGKGLAFLHMVEEFPGSTSDPDARAMLDRLRAAYEGSYIANGGYLADSANAAIGGGKADAVTFGRPFIANPDLPERFRRNAPLNAPDGDTFYGGDETGYTDYPFLSDTAKVA